MFGLRENESLMRLLAAQPVKRMNKEDIEFSPAHRLAQLGHLWSFKEFRTGMDFSIDLYDFPTTFSGVCS
jgi:hypothetical protein